MNMDCISVLNDYSTCLSSTKIYGQYHTLYKQQRVEGAAQITK